MTSLNADNNQRLEADPDPGQPKLKSAGKEAKSFGVKVEKTF